MAPKVVSLKIGQQVPGVTRENLEGWRQRRAPLAIGVPMMEMVPRTSVLTIAAFARRMKPGDEFLFNDHSAAVDFVRNDMIERFLATNAEWLFFMDDDMLLPAEWLDIMTGYNVPFISGYCTRKNYPYLPTCAMFSHQDEHGHYHYDSIVSFEPHTGVYEVDGVGAGFLCIRRDVLEALPKPWFEFLGGGEDFAFCRKVKALGHPILLDTACVVGHVRNETTTIHDFLRVRGELTETKTYGPVTDTGLDFGSQVAN